MCKVMHRGTSVSGRCVQYEALAQSPKESRDSRVARVVAWERVQYMLALKSRLGPKEKLQY